MFFDSAIAMNSCPICSFHILTSVAWVRAQISFSSRFKVLLTLESFVVNIMRECYNEQHDHSNGLLNWAKVTLTTIKNASKSFERRI